MATGVPSAGAPGRTARTRRVDRQGLRIVVVDEHGRPVVARGLVAWLRGVAPGNARGSVAIALVSDRFVRSLNRKYRHKNADTDVLSFPTNPESRIPNRFANRFAERSLGEIAIARGVA